MTRISERYRFNSTSNRIGTAKTIADKAQETVLSGRKLRRVSDDPVGMGRAMKNRSKLDNLTQFRKSIEFSKGFLSKSEESLRSLNDTLIRSSELAIQAANSTYDAGSRKATSEEVRQLTDQAISLGNSSYGNRYVFGGFQTAVPPISDKGEYLGDDGMIFVQLDEDSFRAINLSGREIFGVSADREKIEKPVIESLRGLYSSLVADDKEGIHEAITQIQNSITRVSNSIAILGSRRASVDDLEQRLDQTEEILVEQSNAIESADPVEAAMSLRRAETALQSTLAAGAKILTPSLLNFLQGS